MPVPREEEDSGDADGLVNRFEGLAVFEPSKKFLDAPDVKRPVKTKNDPVTYAADTTASFGDAIIAMLFLLYDLNNLRASIASVWRTYKETCADPVPAAVATNTAIEFVRDMVEDMLPMMAVHGGMQDVLEQCYMYCCAEEGYDDDTIAASLNDEFNETYAIANETFMIASHLLSDFHSEIQPGLLPVYDYDKYGSVDHSIDRSKKSGKAKFQDDVALFTPFFADLLTIVVGPIPWWPVHDEFLNGVEKMIETDEIPFSMVFAAQIFLDVTYILGAQVTQPCTTFQKHVDFMRNDLNKHFEHHEKLKTKAWPAANEDKLYMLERGIYAIRKDPIAQVYGWASGSEKPIPEYQHRIFRMSPILSGLALYHFRIRYRDAGLMVDNFWSAIQGCEHLYNALNSYDQLPDRWVDMDLVKSLLGSDSFYVGGQEPQTSRDQFRKFGLQMGVSAASMTHRRRTGPTILSKAGPRGLKATAEVSSMFYDRYGRNTEIILSAEEVQCIVEIATQDILDDDDAAESSTDTDDDSTALQETGKNKKNKNKAKTTKRRAGGGLLSLGAMTEILAIVMAAEAVELSFPYLQFHRWCWRLLRAVRKECDPPLRAVFGPDYLAEEADLPHMVGYILNMAAGADGAAPCRPGPLVAAGKALKDMVGAGLGSCMLDATLRKTLGLDIVLEEDGAFRLQSGDAGSD